MHTPAPDRINSTNDIHAERFLHSLQNLAEQPIAQRVAKLVRSQCRGELTAMQGCELARLQLYSNAFNTLVLRLCLKTEGSKVRFKLKLTQFVKDGEGRHIRANGFHVTNSDLRTHARTVFARAFHDAGVRSTKIHNNMESIANASTCRFGSPVHNDHYLQCQSPNTHLSLSVEMTRKLRRLIETIIEQKIF